MFSSAWKEQISLQIKQLELQITDLKKNETEIRSQNQRLFQLLKNVGRKLALRLPVSLESLEKGLLHDLIFPDEVDAWRASTGQGLVIDLRAASEFQKNSVPGSVNIPFDQLISKLEHLARETPLLIICENGIKSASMCEQLSAKGFGYLYVLKGGIALYRGQQMVDKEIAAQPELMV